MITSQPAIHVQTPHTAIRLDAHHLFKTIDGKRILTDISLSIHPGECVGLLGPSGAGKSTLLTVLNGFRPAEKGRVLLNSTNLYKNFDRFRSTIGYVPQDDIVHTSLSVYKALYYSALLRVPRGRSSSKALRTAIQQRVTEVLHTLGLEEQRKIKIRRLSGGQRKRVNLGIELLTSPPLLFLDEPTSGLDPALEDRMMQLFHTLARQGRTVILTTHIMESLRVLDLVAILTKGHLVFYGPPQLALNAFKVKDFADIYGRLEKYHAAELAEQFKHSSIYKKYVMSRLAKRYKTEHILEQSSSAQTKPATSKQSGQNTTVTQSSHESDETSRAAAPEELTLEQELEQLKRRVQEEQN